MSDQGSESSTISPFRRLIVGLMIAAVCGGVIFLLRTKEEEYPNKDQIPSAPQTVETAPPPERNLPIPPAARKMDPSVTLFQGAEDLGNLLHSTESDPGADLDAIQDLLRVYRRANQGANPSGGENEEIVAGLLGKNAIKMAFLPVTHPAINEHGKLLDRWGTPYWFHPISRDFMEVRSAGPDRELFTEDDVTTETSDEIGASN